MGLYLNGYKVLEGSFIVATDGVSLKPLADDTYYLGSTAYRFAGGYFGGNGIDVNPDSDVDADLITMSVTGNPKFWWDESEDAFAATKGMLFAGPIAVTAFSTVGSYAGNLLHLEATKTILTGDNSEYIANVIAAYYAKTAEAYSGISIGTVSRAILAATNTQNWSATEQRGGIVGLEGAVRIATGSGGTVANATDILAKGEGEFLLGATVTNWRQILIENVTGAGVGNLVNLYGLYIQTITGASGLNYAIYSEGGLSYHGGDFIFVGDIIAGGGDGGVVLLADGVIRGPALASGAGDDDVAGADVYFQGAVGRGAGDVGQLIFQTAQVAAADTAQTLETILTLDEDAATFAKNVYVNSTVDAYLNIVGAGARVDANTPSGRLYMARDIPSGTNVAADDVAALIHIGSTDGSGNDGDIAEVDFLTSVVTAGAVVSDIVFKTVQAAAIGTVAEAMRIQNKALKLVSGGAIQINNLQVVGARQVDARINDTPNSGDGTTDGIIAALQACVQTHGLMAAA